eukprot:9056389-Ditylum_brightwellii.AAC.2
MANMPMAKRSKVSTLMNIISLCKTKENILETIANWFSLLNDIIAVKEAAPPLLYNTCTLDFTPAFGTDAVSPGRDEQACQHASPDF